MGCDIHLYAEYRKSKRSKWKSLDKWTLDTDYEPPRKIVEYKDKFYTGGRNYNLFCALANARSFMFNGETPCVSKPKGIPNDCSKEVKLEREYWGSDGHTHSWNTLKELKAFDWSTYGDTVTNFLNEVLPKLEAVGVDEEDVRIVYFFDN